MQSTRDKGLEGEEIAARFLKKSGYKILERNYRTKFGEIDIIAQKGKSIVFIEVKTRCSDDFGSPVEAVDNKKLTKLVNVASHYIQKNRFENNPIRFEVVSILKKQDRWSCEIIPVD
ncbi:MAG: YraN family protein [Candidatus Omnitrophica bacterium]|nr:YraN family protein [Candidatus Omnitrophota bacterium]MCM8817343.1 YraN family protein [Candidatus Omnitrophota bacterium]